MLKWRLNSHSLGAFRISIESLDKNEPEYIIEVPDKKIKKCGGEPVEKPLFGEDGKIDLSTVREDRAGADCYIIAVLQSLARYNPDYITKHLIKDDPKDPKWAIVTLFDEMGRKQKIRVQKTPILKGGIDPDERALWVQCVSDTQIYIGNMPLKRRKFSAIVNELNSFTIIYRGGIICRKLEKMYRHRKIRFNIRIVI